MDNLIYGLYCPIRKKPVYIGKSTTGIDRPFEHIKDRSHSIKVKEWIRSLREDGLMPVIVVLEKTDDVSILEEKETFWIHKFLAEGNLLLNQRQITSPIFNILPLSDNIINGGMSDISSFVKGRRKMLNLTQKELSLKTGMGLRFIRGIENGYKDNFSTKAVIRLLSFLGSKLTVVSIK
jgi:hypothetical protein